jgi:hypothetical protein
VSKAGAVIITFVIYENLSLVLQAAESGRIYDPVPIPLITGPVAMFRFFINTPLCKFALLSIRGE